MSQSHQAHHRLLMHREFRPILAPQFSTEP